MPSHSSRRPVSRRPSCVSWEGWSVAPHPEGTRAPVLWGCAALLPPTVAQLWTPCRPGEPLPLWAPGPRAAPRPRTISAGRSVSAVASPCPPPRHDCPPEAGRVGPQREAWRVQAALAAADTARPRPNPASGGAAPPNLAAGLLGTGRGGSQAPSRTWSRSPQACEQQRGAQSRASRTRRGSFRCRSSAWEPSTARGHAGGSGAPRGPRPARHAAGTVGAMRAWGARVCAQVCVPVAYAGTFAHGSAHACMPVVWVHCVCA